MTSERIQQLCDLAKKRSLERPDEIVCLLLNNSASCICAYGTPSMDEMLNKYKLKLYAKFKCGFKYDE